MVLGNLVKRGQCIGSITEYGVWSEELEGDHRLECNAGIKSYMSERAQSTPRCKSFLEMDIR